MFVLYFSKIMPPSKKMVQLDFVIPHGDKPHIRVKTKQLDARDVM